MSPRLRTASRITHSPARAASLRRRNAVLRHPAALIAVVEVVAPVPRVPAVEVVVEAAEAVVLRMVVAEAVVAEAAATNSGCRCSISHAG
jgi:hypothetical protein